MNYSDTSARLADYRSQIAAIRDQMRQTQAAVEPEEVRDYEFATIKGNVKMSELFGKKDRLFVVHNMGKGCPSCTMWADGFNGIFHHVSDRAAFVVCSPDTPAVQQDFAAGRGWKFPMVSHRNTTFAADMGYSANGRTMPGISVFKRKDGAIMRVADSAFADGDDFCAVWRLFDLLPEGAAGWRARFAY